MLSRLEVVFIVLIAMPATAVHAASPQIGEPKSSAPKTGDLADRAQRALTPPALNGGTAATKKRSSVFDDPLAGVVINRTVTVQGKDFYQFFATLWRQKEAGSRFTISIHERPSARWGSEVWVQFGQKRMFHTFLPPARSATRKISALAVDIVEQNIADSEVERIMVHNPDLGPEEI
jgi:curli production assembly/transport component CsgE